MYAHKICRCLDAFSKTFGIKKKLGEEFLREVTRLKFASNASKMPMIRNALVATNLISPKVKDGIARLIVVSDVQHLGKRERTMEIMAAETLLLETWDAIVCNIDRELLSATQAYQLWGRMAARVVLLLTKNGRTVRSERNTRASARSSALTLLRLTNSRTDTMLIWCNRTLTRLLKAPLCEG